MSFNKKQLEDLLNDKRAASYHHVALTRLDNNAYPIAQQLITCMDELEALKVENEKLISGGIIIPKESVISKLLAKNKALQTRVDAVKCKIECLIVEINDDPYGMYASKVIDRLDEALAEISEGGE